MSTLAESELQLGTRIKVERTARGWSLEETKAQIAANFARLFQGRF